MYRMAFWSTGCERRTRCVVRIAVLAYAIACLNGCGRSDSASGVATDLADCQAQSIRLVELLDDASGFADLVTAVDSIRLESTEESFLASASAVHRHPGGFVVVDERADKALLFAQDGSFVAKFGVQGDGPAEYRGLRDGQVRPNGNVLLLALLSQELLEFAPDGRFIRELPLRDLGIRPDEMRLVGDDSTEWLLFHDLDGSQDGPAAGSKIIVAELTDDGLRYDRSFGTPEPLLQRLGFRMASFGVQADGRIWVSKVFELETEIFEAGGEPWRIADSPTDVLPGPHLTPEMFERFDRPSAASTTYNAATRAFKFVFASLFVAVSYYAGARDEAYLLFYSNCGELLRPYFRSDSFPLFYAVRGTWGDTLAAIREAVSPDAPGDAANPTLLLYRIK